jgi:hypothetical protein
LGLRTQAVAVAAVLVLAWEVQAEPAVEEPEGRDHQTVGQEAEQMQL